jgi:hypothetical protein
MSTKFLTKLKKAGKQKEDTLVYEGETFTIRDMTGTMRDYWDADSKKRIKFKGKHPDLNTMELRGQRALMVAMTLVDDETNELAFDYESKEDLEIVGGLSGGLLDAMMDKALTLCGLNPKAVEGDEKNS